MSPLSLRPLAIVAMLCALYGTARAVRPGDPDPAFGAGGTVRVPVPSGDAEDVLVLPDGSIVLGGTGDPEGNGRTKFVLARLDAAGALVPEFGTAGLVVTRLPRVDTARIRRLALDLDGHILAAGISVEEFPNGDVRRSVRMARYFLDGALDGDFGDDGVRSAGPARDVAGVVVLDDRNIAFVGRDDDMVIGFVLPGRVFRARQLPGNSDGADVVRHAGGLIMAGTFDGDFFLFRLSEAIGLDSQFGDAGEVRTPIGAGADRLRKLLVLPDDRLMAIGATDVALGDTDIALVRYTADGALDSTFGDGGIVVTPLGSQRDDVLDAVLAPDGTMLVGGRTCSSPSACHGFVARLLADGHLDSSFGDGGLVATTGNVTAVAMPDDGHVLAVEEASGEFVVHRLIVAECGNGRLEAGEACDDGNTAAGDCCGATCALEPDDAPCADDGSVCTADVCRAGACTHAVPAEAGCLPATTSAFARVDDPVAGEKVRWSWQSATPVDRTSFGNPTDATDLTVCVVDGAGESERALLEVTIPAAGTCGDLPCWKETRRGFRFRDATATDGVTVLRLVSGAEGSRIALKARNLGAPSDLPVLVRVRLVRHDAPTCFEADLVPAPGAGLRFQSR